MGAVFVAGSAATAKFRGWVKTEVQELADSTRTAVEAAAAIGTTVAQIAKSLVFMAGTEPLLVIAAGSNRVCLNKLADLVGQPVAQAAPKKVRQVTGFPVGGVPPVGHQQPLPTLMDVDLLQNEEIWAAGGTPRTVFAIAPAELVRITGGRVADVREP